MFKERAKGSEKVNCFVCSPKICVMVVKSLNSTSLMRSKCNNTGLPKAVLSVHDGAIMADSPNRHTKGTTMILR